MAHDDQPIKGRGASTNPRNRFTPLSLEGDPDGDTAAEPTPQTRFFQDHSSSIISHNESPDVGFSTSINPYRGCEHGCIYCYARTYHEYLGFSAGLDFETRILVKSDAPELLRRALSSPRWQPQVIALSGVTDPYQPVERRLGLTRRCLEVLAEFRNPVTIVTKNHLVTRDADLLAELARHQAAAVYLSVTTLDADLARTLEPRTTTPAGRLAAITALARAGVPVGALIAPVIPGLTDHELPAIVQAVANAGGQSACYVPLRLLPGIDELFTRWLGQHRPDREQKVLQQIHAMRGGQLDDPKFGSRMRGHGIFAEQLAKLFAVACRKAGLGNHGPDLSTAAFRRPPGPQLPLFA